MEEQAVQIRHLRQEDFQIWKEIRLESVKNHPTSFGGSYEEESLRSDENWRGFLTSANVFGAFIQEKIVGCLGYYINDGEKAKHRAGVCGMYIRPEARGKGVGKVLLQHVRDHAKEREVMQLHLTVLTTNYTAINLYLKFGFVIYGTEPRSLKIGDTFYDEYMMVMYITP
jgi:ribosomal protein S18 acetylase RimI-like enzyme